MSRALILILIFFLAVNFSRGQNSKGEMAAYNIALGSIFGGVGAVINKKPEQKFGKVLLKGISQGALGGYMVYQGKNFIGKIASSEKLGYGWAAKFANSAGASIIENASLNKNFWEQWNVNIGFNRFEIRTTNGLNLKYRIMPIAFVATGITFFTSRFETRTSLETGEFIFSNNSSFPLEDPAGIAYATAIVLYDEFKYDFRVISHELIHVHQYYDFNPVNSFLSKPIKKLESSSKLLNKLNNIIYWDMHAAVLFGLYQAENIGRSDYYDNFFENEAHFWSERSFKP